MARRWWYYAYEDKGDVTVTRSDRAHSEYLPTALQSLESLREALTEEIRAHQREVRTLRKAIRASLSGKVTRTWEKRK